MAKKYLVTDYIIVRLHGLLTVRKWYCPDSRPYKLSFYYETGVDVTPDFKDEDECTKAFNTVVAYLESEEGG